MKPAHSLLGVDPGLLERFRRAGATIAWRAAAGSPRRSPAPNGRRGTRASARIARLDDEEARVEARPGRSGGALIVESGPVGALVLLLEADRRGAVPQLTSLDAGVDPAFPHGAIAARFASTGRSTLGVKDLVEVARYALR